MKAYLEKVSNPKEPYNNKIFLVMVSSAVDVVHYELTFRHQAKYKKLTEGKKKERWSKEFNVNI